MSEKEYIEREALLAEYDRVHVGAPGGARKLIAEAPAADVAEVARGKWKLWGSECVYYCSVCRMFWAFPREARMWNYCPQCGAKMDKEPAHV